MNPTGLQESSATVTLSSDELDQVKALLRRLLEAKAADAGEGPIPSAHKLLKIAKFSQLVRDKRQEFFSRSMFGEPAWDLLLALYIEQASGAPSTASTLAKAACTPVSTAMRWIDYLEEKELVVRQRSDQDRRSSIVALSDKGRETLDRYFARTLQGLAALYLEN